MRSPYQSLLTYYGVPGSVPNNKLLKRVRGFLIPSVSMNRRSRFSFKFGSASCHITGLMSTHIFLNCFDIGGGHRFDIMQVFAFEAWFNITLCSSYHVERYAIHYWTAVIISDPSFQASKSKLTKSLSWECFGHFFKLSLHHQPNRDWPRSSNLLVEICYLIIFSIEAPLGNKKCHMSETQSSLRLYNTVFEYLWEALAGENVYAL